MFKACFTWEIIFLFCLFHQWISQFFFLCYFMLQFSHDIIIFVPVSADSWHSTERAAKQIESNEMSKRIFIHTLEKQKSSLIIQYDLIFYQKQNFLFIFRHFSIRAEKVDKKKEFIDFRSSDWKIKDYKNDIDIHLEKSQDVTNKFRAWREEDFEEIDSEIIFV